MADNNYDNQIPTIEIQGDVEKHKVSDQLTELHTVTLSSQCSELNSEYFRRVSSGCESGYSSCLSHFDSGETWKRQEEPSQHDNPELQGYLLAFDDWVKTQKDISYLSQTGTFAAAFFDKSGGYLSLPKYNTSMFVPPGAVTRNQKLYIFVEVKSPSLPCPVKDAQWQPHILHCGPTRVSIRIGRCFVFPTRFI